MSDIPQTGRARTEPGHHERRLTDPHFLVHADPAEVLALLDSARGPEEQLAAAVYRASAHLHRHSGAARRQLLALDAARFGDRGLSERITAVLLEGEPGGSAARWYVDWATGAPDHRFRHRLSRHALWVGAVATAVV
ncbi:hypothetical protein AB0K43_10715, partial [Kitasatospora sp. NPDC049258]|uniref:hypothetical protein n=1 Tax=Kitasatospora sp. NPDC049258 TaxID=3155394 RepID=UPI003419676A